MNPFKLRKLLKQVKRYVETVDQINLEYREMIASQNKTIDVQSREIKRLRELVENQKS